MNAHKILLVEDDVNLGTVLKEYLSVKGFIVDHEKNGIDGLAAFHKVNYDLLILDIMMPKMDGMTVASKIRGSNSDVPIIFLTAKTLQNDKIEGFKIGADDYITKPFNTEEMLLRINAVLKRSRTPQPATQHESTFTIGAYKFDYNRRLLTIGDNKSKLTSKEADLLRILCSNKNEVTERNLALKTIWGDDNYFTSRSMDVYIVKLRNYFKDDESIEITNVHGIGFKLIAP